MGGEQRWPFNDAVMYLTREDQLRGAMATAHAHCRPSCVALSCVALFVPDATCETWAEETGSGGHDGEGGRSLRYFNWTQDPDPSDTKYRADFAIFLREGRSPPRLVHDVHENGIFRHDTWLRLLGEAGFDATTLSFRHSSFTAPHRPLFLGVRR